MIEPPAARPRDIVSTHNFRPLAGLALLVFLSSCGSIASPSSSSNEFSSGNFSINLVASSACAALADAGRNRNFKIGLVKTGSSVSSVMQGWSDSATVFAQTNLAGTATGSALTLSGYIFETINGCSDPLCYRAEGTLTATQSGNVLNGTLNGVLTYELTTCTAPDHKVTLTRQ
jgi:hypothetical protein